MYVKISRTVLDFSIGHKVSRSLAYVHQEITVVLETFLDYAETTSLIVAIKGNF